MLGRGKVTRTTDLGTRLPHWTGLSEAVSSQWVSCWLGRWHLTLLFLDDHPALQSNSVASRHLHAASTRRGGRLSAEKLRQAVTEEGAPAAGERSL